jgi:hypothetical protein
MTFIFLLAGSLLLTILVGIGSILFMLAQSEDFDERNK